MDSEDLMKVMLAAGDALLLVDMQNDFLPGGSLPVPGGERLFRCSIVISGFSVLMIYRFSQRATGIRQTTAPFFREGALAAALYCRNAGRSVS